MEDNQKQKCDICGISSGHEEKDTLLFGDWMVHKELRVHYYCLLLSTNLPQRGGDSSGILGFLLRDIRQLVAVAKTSKCIFCTKVGATIQCHGCRAIFHSKCGLINRCNFEFQGQFHSYCFDCTPMDDYKRQLVANPPKHIPCDICLAPILHFSLHNVVYGDCCRQGFAHKNCMREYALAAGYYLRCIWCRSEKFRDMIRLQAIFVPDRDAKWEREQNAYRELHERNVRCDVEPCLCPSGRVFNKNTWLILACKLCASTGAHAKCLAGTLRLSKGTESTEFKCAGCLDVERNLANGPPRNMDASMAGIEGHVDASFYVPKTGPEMPAPHANVSPVFSEDNDTDISTNSNNSCSSTCSNITVIPSQPRARPASVSPLPNIASPPPEPVIEILDSQPQLADADTHAITNDMVVIPSQTKDNSASVSAEPTIDSPPPELVIETPVSQPTPPPVTEVCDLLEKDSNSPPPESVSEPHPWLDEDSKSRLELKESFCCPGEPYFYLVFYEFEHITCLCSCTGSCTLRFSEDDPRIQDKTTEALELLKVMPADVWFRNKDRGPFEQTDRIKRFCMCNMCKENIS
ncbi:pineapple eye protein [Drosophila gunungcola]|uniref:PHD-type domain-containing protein n=1 Tax=Drosophila gunungcola TaxID=103775 RepID=A0A9P9YUJ1_9MUSC|nr:pineapple eye protein [Drosophila gunungcola]KAI8043332.1 hypothetical protein M5D96_004661 [Drosophila gunungcola]